MKILTKKKQEKILESLIKSGTVLCTDETVSVNVFNNCNGANYDIANLVGDFGMVTQYHDVIDRVLQNELAKKGGKG